MMGVDFCRSFLGGVFIFFRKTVDKYVRICYTVGVRAKLKERSGRL